MFSIFILLALGARALAESNIQPATTTNVTSPRRLQEFGANDLCQAAVLLQPIAGGQEIVLEGQSTAILSQDMFLYSLCDRITTSSTYHNFYKIEGTGNYFYMTTCATSSGNFVGSIEVSSIVGCRFSGFSCVERFPSTSCPGQEGKVGATAVFQTEPNVDYYISIEGDAIYNLRVGQGSQAVENTSCIDARRIPTPEVGSQVTVVGDTLGLVNGFFSLTEDGPCTSETAFSRLGQGLWFTLDAPTDQSVRLSINTCSESTTVSSTSIAYSVIRTTDSEKSCDDGSLSCQSQISQSLIGCQNPNLAGADSIISRPGENLQIFVTNNDLFTPGNIAITVTAAPVNAFDLCFDEAVRREESKEGVVCSCNPDIFVSDESPSRLTCQDGCEYCDGDNAVCVGRTDQTVYLGGKEAERITTVNYLKGGQGSMVLFDLMDASCAFEIDGQKCASCTPQACGYPRVDCSNIKTGLERIDLCSTTVVDGFFFPAMASESLCAQYQSQTKCAETSDAFDRNQGLACTCTPNEFDGSSQLRCETLCGAFCNSDQSVCSYRTIESTFNAFGQVEGRRDFLSFVTGFDEQDYTFETFGDTDSFCSFSDSDLEFCDSCQLQRCSNGEQRPILSCPKLFGTPQIYNACDSASLRNTPLESFFDDQGQFQCTDRKLPNALCATPRRILVNEPFLIQSNDAVLPNSNDGCTEASGGLFYEVVGNGNLYKATTCNDATKIDTVISLSTGDCETPSCVDFNDDGDDCGSKPTSTLSWQTNAGEVYRLYVAGWGASSGSIAFHVEDSGVGPIPEESCSEATALPVGDPVVTGTITFGLTEPSRGCFGREAGEYFEVVGNGNIFIATTCHDATQVDTVISLSSGSCAAPVCLDENDDDMSCGTSSVSSTLSFPTVQGEVYYLHVSGYRNSEGVFGITVLDSGTQASSQPTASPTTSSTNSMETSPGPRAGCLAAMSSLLFTAHWLW